MKYLKNDLLIYAIICIGIVGYGYKWAQERNPGPSQADINQARESVAALRFERDQYAAKERLPKIDSTIAGSSLLFNGCGLTVNSLGEGAAAQLNTYSGATMAMHAQVSGDVLRVLACLDMAVQAFPTILGDYSMDGNTATVTISLLGDNP